MLLSFLFLGEFAYLGLYSVFLSSFLSVCCLLSKTLMRYQYLQKSVLYKLNFFCFYFFLNLALVLFAIKMKARLTLPHCEVTHPRQRVSAGKQRPASQGPV